MLAFLPSFSTFYQVPTEAIIITIVTTTTSMRRSRGYQMENLSRYILNKIFRNLSWINTSLKVISSPSYNSSITMASARRFQDLTIVYSITPASCNQIRWGVCPSREKSSRRAIVDQGRRPRLMNTWSKRGRTPQER